MKGCSHLHKHLIVPFLFLQEASPPFTFNSPGSWCLGCHLPPSAQPREFKDVRQSSLLDQSRSAGSTTQGNRTGTWISVWEGGDFQGPSHIALTLPISLAPTAHSCNLSSPPPCSALSTPQKWNPGRGRGSPKESTSAKAHGCPCVLCWSLLLSVTQLGMSGRGKVLSEPTPL